MNNKREKLLKRVDKHPHIEARLEVLLNLAENVTGEFDKADDAEEQLIVEIRKMGNELLQAWAAESAEKAIQKAQESNPRLIKHSKKNSTGRQHSVI